MAAAIVLASLGFVSDASVADDPGSSLMTFLVAVLVLSLPRPKGQPCSWCHAHATTEPELHVSAVVLALTPPRPCAGACCAL